MNCLSPCFLNVNNRSWSLPHFPSAHRVRLLCRNLRAERSKQTELVDSLRQPTALHEQDKAAVALQRKAARAAVAALSQVWFQQEDVVTAEHEPASIDCVLCMSVTKWIHLNGGDDALEQLFSTVYKVLTPGGHFVLEAQPWRSYKKARLKMVGDAWVFKRKLQVMTCLCWIAS